MRLIASAECFESLTARNRYASARTMLLATIGRGEGERGGEDLPEYPEAGRLQRAHARAREGTPLEKPTTIDRIVGRRDT